MALGKKIITLEKLQRQLKKMPNWKAPGPDLVQGSSIGDGGSGAFLRNCAQTEPSPILLFHFMESIYW